MSHFVEILVRSADGQEHRVTGHRGEPIVIGRDCECEVVIADNAIAPRHARLIWQGDAMRLEPLAETPALWVDALPVESALAVRSDQTIGLGAATISWRLLPGEESPTIAANYAPKQTHDSAAEMLAREINEGRYGETESQLGAGGMGKVHEVFETLLRRRVAMKVMLAPDSGRDQERFIREARITGQLEHPSIVPVHELNVDRRGQIFYTMKLLRGVTLAQVLKELAAGKPDAFKRYDLPALLIIYQKLCDAIAFAHSRKPAVIHRDLKPENIMVGEYGEVQVMDWGLAKILGKSESPAIKHEYAKREIAPVAATPSSQEVSAVPYPHSPVESAIIPEIGLTLEGEIIGTPAYMPPEQARGDTSNQDQRTDIYALGSILYTILFLTPPIELSEHETQQLQQQRRFGEEAARTFWHGLSSAFSDRIQRGEVALAVRKGKRLPKLRYSPWLPIPESLAAVIRKAMALRPEDRYSSVLALQADVAAYQKGFATKAEEARAWRHFLLFVRRHKAVSIATAFALLLIALLSAAFLVAVSRERDRVRASNVALQQNLTQASFADLEAARSSFRKGEARTGIALLGRALVYAPQNQAASDYLLSALTVAGGDFDLLPRFGVFHTAPGTAVDFSPDGSFFATASYDRTARIWETASGKPVAAVMTHSAPLSSIKFSPNGKEILTTGEDGFARLWDAKTGVPVGHAMRHDKIVESGVFSPDGRWILTACWDGFARIWNAETGEELRCFPHRAEVGMASFNFDASRVVTASWDHTAQVWNATTGDKVGGAMQHSETVRRAFLNPDGTRVVTASKDGTARIWDATTGAPISPPLQHGGFVWTAAISPDGKLLATASHDNQARLWRMEDGAPVGQPMQHAAPLESISYSPDGARLLTSSRDSTVRIWNGKTGEPLGRVMRHDNSVLVAAWKPDGSQILSTGWDNAAYLWDAGPAPLPGQLLPLRGSVLDAEFTRDGDTLLLALDDNTARFWSLQASDFAGPVFNHGAALDKARLSPDQSTIATAGADRAVRLWHRDTGELLGQTPAQDATIVDLVFAPDGASFFTGDVAGQLRRWLVPSCKPIGNPFIYPGEIYAIAIAPDASEIAAGGRDYFISRYDLRRDGPPDRRIRLDEYAVALSYSPDGKRLATGSERRSARIWTLAPDPVSSAHFVVNGKVSSVSWSSDGNRLFVSGSEDPHVFCFDAESGVLALEPFPHRSGVLHMAVTPDGSGVVTVGADGKPRRWPASAPLPSAHWLQEYLRATCGVAFSKEQQLVPVQMRERLALREKLVGTQPADAVWREVLGRNLRVSRSPRMSGDH